MVDAQLATHELALAVRRSGRVALHPGDGLTGRIAGGRDRDGLESPVNQVPGDARELPVDRLQQMVQHGAEW